MGGPCRIPRKSWRRPAPSRESPISLSSSSSSTSSSVTVSARPRLSRSACVADQSPAQNAVVNAIRSGTESTVICFDELATSVHLSVVRAALQLFYRELPCVHEEHTEALFRDGKHRLIVVVKNRMVRAAALFRHYSGFDRAPPFTELVLLATHHLFRRRGLAREAVTFLKRVASKKSNILVTYADNRAVEFFRKLGFDDDLIFNKSRYTSVLYPYENARLMDIWLNSKCM